MSLSTPPPEFSSHTVSNPRAYHGLVAAWQGALAPDGDQFLTKRNNVKHAKGRVTTSVTFTMSVYYQPLRGEVVSGEGPRVRVC